MEILNPCFTHYQIMSDGESSKESKQGIKFNVQIRWKKKASKRQTETHTERQRHRVEETHTETVKETEEMFYLMTYSTHYIYGFMVSGIW